MRRVAAKFVPKLLSPKQKELHVEVAQDLLDTTSPSPTSLLSRHGSLQLLVVSEIEDDIERIPF
jgi:hypothetical protein